VELFIRHNVSAPPAPLTDASPEAGKSTFSMPRSRITGRGSNERQYRDAADDAEAKDGKTDDGTPPASSNGLVSFCVDFFDV